MPDGTNVLPRRRFLALGAAALLSPALGAACARRPIGPPWQSLRLIHEDPGELVVRTSIRDAAGLLARATGVPVPIAAAEPAMRWGAGGVFLAASSGGASLLPEWRCSSSTPGAFRILTPASSDSPTLVVAGADAEGARNGLYQWLQLNGFGFFRDGETIPRPSGQVADAVQDEELSPAFRWRGDMIWDNYLGPRRYCAAAWHAGDWERALLYLARNGLNFLEFYPPMEGVFARAFPDARGLSEGAVWKADAKEALMRHVLERGRALGIRFKYVLSYGAFQAAVRAIYPRLEWANGFLCAYQTELQGFTRRVWAELIDTFGTDHLYAIRHRGEEGRSYSDPCRSVTKADGFNQAIPILRELDANSTIAVWTWSETLPDLFEELPGDVRAAHIRHGMGGMFADRGVGREQSDGRPNLPPEQRWLAGQFTVFSGADTLPQTTWSDASSLARDARAAAADPYCEGYFRWPEWSNTSPWLADAIRSLAWDPATFGADRALQAYARQRHGANADAFLAGFATLVMAGNARSMATPRKRLLAPYFLDADALTHLTAVRNGLRAMADALSRPVAPGPLFHCDLVDVLSWAAVRQAHVLEAASYVAFRAQDPAGVVASIRSAQTTWSILRTVLDYVPELSLVETARSVARTAAISGRAVDSFWTLGCDFYNGYPLVLSPEAVELVFLDQCGRLGRALADALEVGNTTPLATPGWFWHDFPDPAWADLVLELPREDADHFEQAMRLRFQEAVEAGAAQSPIPMPAFAAPTTPALPSTVDSSVLAGAVNQLTSIGLAPPLDGRAALA